MSAGAALDNHNEGDMVKKIARYFLASPVLKGSAAAFALKFTASVLGFTMFALASRSMDPAGFGSLAIIFNAMSFFSVVALCGQETLIVRSWNEYCGIRPSGIGARRAEVRRASGIRRPAAGGLGGGRRLVHLGSCRFARLWCLPLARFFSCTRSCSSAVNSRVLPPVSIVGETPREFLWRLFVVAALLVYHWMNVDFGAAGFLATLAAAIFVAISLQLWRVAPSIPEAVKRAQPRI